LTGGRYIKKRLEEVQRKGKGVDGEKGVVVEVPICIGKGIVKVQEVVKRKYALPESFKTDGSQFGKVPNNNNNNNNNNNPPPSLTCLVGFHLEFEFSFALDILVCDGDTFRIGETLCKVLHTPGHTPDSNTYLIGSQAYGGDTLFQPDVSVKKKKTSHL
jgi:hypothetical protein